MDAEQALADLMELSAHVEAAVVLDPDGAVAASSQPREEAERLARAARAAAAAAEAVRPGERLAQLEASTRRGSLLLVRDGGRIAAATVRGGAGTELVLHDLRACLRAAEGAAA